MGFIATLQAFFNSLTEIAKAQQSNNEFGAEKDILRIKKKLKRKSDRQEDLILDMAKLLEKYYSGFKPSDKMLAKCCLIKVKKLN